MSVRVIVPSEDPIGCADLDGVVVHRVRVAHGVAETLRDQDALAGQLRRPRIWAALLRGYHSLRTAARREIARGADIVHAHCWMPAGLATPPGVPLVLTIYGGDAGLLQRSRVARSLARPLWRRTALVTAVSHQVGESLQSVAARAVPPEQVHPMPMDTRGAPWTRGGGGAVVWGRLDQRSRTELALEALAILSSAGRPIPLTVIGDGPSRTALERRAEQLGVAPQVKFVGSIPADQARVHLARADVLLFAGKMECSAAAAMEALVIGVPVVACWDSGAAVGVVPQSGAGRLCLPAAEALAESVLHLIADKDRLELGRLVGEAWRARLMPDHVAERCESWYRNALAR